jgi:hypothetical protein
MNNYRDRLFSALKQLDPEGIHARRQGLQRKKGAYIVSGPNRVWSVDGYCKLEPFGIEIYACIDAYSRYIIWIYAGITGRTAVSVATQYLLEVKESGIIPVLIRSDRGLETPMAADLHYMLRTQADQDEQIEFSKTWAFGKSTKNIRIESWWGQLSSGQIGQWREYFQKMIIDEIYNSDRIEDRIAMRAIYIPLIRAELALYGQNWNAHRIRKQAERIHSIKGIPRILYQCPEQTGAVNEAISVNPEYVQSLIDQYGLEQWDVDEYLPVHTRTWCERTLLELDIDLRTLQPKDAFPDGDRIHCFAYEHLRQALQENFQSGNRAGLTESEKPRGAYNWIPSIQVQTEYARGIEGLQPESIIELENDPRSNLE